MAKDKAKNAANTAPIQFQGATFSDDDFEVIGGLRHVCLPELNEGKPVVGFPLAILSMTEKFKWDKALLVHLVSPARVKVDEEIIDAQPGEDVIIPLRGQLKNNAALLAVAIDPKVVTLARFKYLGEVDVGKESNMKDFEVSVAMQKRLARTPAFTLALEIADSMNRAAAAAKAAADALPRGDLRNTDGTPAKPLFGGASS